MNPTDEFQKLIALYPGGGGLFASVEHIPAELAAEPYKELLVHNGHMTLAMEKFHRSPVVVEVLHRNLQGNIYNRAILLKRRNDEAVVQFAAIRFDLSAVSPAVRDEILSEQIPLGRILINHDVSCLVELGAILRITSGPELARLCRYSVGQTAYGRLATIFCDGRPVLDLLEVAVLPET